MLQLFIVYYLPGMLSSTGINPFGQLDNWLYFNADIENGGALIATLIAFIINYAAYFSEIFRGGIESIPKGQYEAGQVLGLTKSQTFFKIVLFQVVKRIVQPMSNEIITLVKDTSLARIIAVSEILMAAERFSGRGLIWPLFYTGVYFLLFNGVLTVLFNKIEKKLDARGYEYRGIHDMWFPEKTVRYKLYFKMGDYGDNITVYLSEDGNRILVSDLSPEEEKELME